MLSLSARLDRLAPGAFAAAAAVAFPFVAALLVLQLALPPTLAQLRAADPIVQSLAAMAGAWLTLVIGLGVCSAWLRRMERDALITGVKHALAGVAAAAVVALVIRVVVGPHLPGFVPPEESSAPGVTLGLNAGLCEELLFRLVVLPAVFFGLRARVGARGAMVAAIAVSAVAFVLSHELPPAGGAFELRYVATRFVIPGVAMSAACFVISPAFMVAAHVAAHLAIPALF